MPEENNTIKLTVNGVDHEIEVSPQAKLADLLRHDLGLTGTKIGCGDGQCGSCVVLVDGRPVRSCVYQAGETPTNCTHCRRHSSTTEQSSAAFAHRAF